MRWLADPRNNARHGAQPILTAHWWPIVSNWKLTSDHKSSRSQQLQISSHSLWVSWYVRPNQGLEIEEINILGKSNASDSPQELDLESVMKLSFLIICLLRVMFIFRRTKTRPYFQIIFNNFSLESIFYEFLTDTNIHCRNESEFL